jgi:hypothetical protein
MNEKNETYKDWRLFDDMPTGWKLDKTCGSPLTGYQFINNGKSIFNGGKRALLRIRQAPQVLLDAPDNPILRATISAAPIEKIDEPYPAKTVNELARQRFKMKLLSDIRCDLMVCELEGWGKMEYINEIRRLINNIGSQVTIDT